jgi:hypothetical protein
MAVRLSALHTRRTLLPRNIIFMLLVNLKIYLIGSRTRDFPVCSIVPQPLRYHVPREQDYTAVEQRKINSFRGLITVISVTETGTFSLSYWILLKAVMGQWAANANSFNCKNRQGRVFIQLHDQNGHEFLMAHAVTRKIERIFNSKRDVLTE